MRDCIESPCSDDLLAWARVHADPIVETSDKLASRLKQFIDEEDREAIVTRSLARAAEQKAGGPEQKHNSHEHNAESTRKTKLCSVRRPYQRVTLASGRTALTCERYHGGTIYARGCSDYIWTMDEKLEKLLPTDNEVGSDASGRSRRLATARPDPGSRRSSLAKPQREQAREGAGSSGSISAG